MKKKIGLFLAVVMLTAMVLSMGTASALSTPKTIYFYYYDNAYPYTTPITDYTLPTSTTIAEGGTFYYSSIYSLNYYINGVKTGTPSYITYADGNTALYILVTRKTSTGTTPTPTYYPASGVVGYTGSTSYLYLGNGDYIYPSIESANPLPTVAAGGVIPITQNQLGGLAVSNTHLTYSTYNPAIATVTGPIIYGMTAGATKLYVYYDSSLILVKDIVVTGSSTSGSIVESSSDLVIGPATFTATKGKSYKFAKCTLDGDAISPSKLIWTTSNSSIATVSKSGVVRARKAGTVTITAETADGEYSASVDFLVQ